MRLACLLMAAGAGTRFGGCKQLAQINGRPMIEHALSTLSPIFGSDLFTVLGSRREKLEPLVAPLSHVIAHPHWQAGLGSSIARGVSELCQHADYQAVLIALADQPDLQSKDYRKLITGFDGSRIVAVDYDGSPGVPAIFPSRFFASLKRLRGDRGAKSLLINAGEEVARLCIPAARRDLDRREDVETKPS